MISLIKAKKAEVGEGILGEFLAGFQGRYSSNRNRMETRKFGRHIQRQDSARVNLLYTGIRYVRHGK